MKKFTTIMKWSVNADLIKMTGQIPYHMFKEFGYDSELVSYDNSTDAGFSAAEKSFNMQTEPYFYLDSLVRGLKLVLLDRIGTRFGLDRAILKYIRDYAQEIDVLNLYHYSLQTLLYTIYFKVKNPGGIVYVTLDNDLGSLRYNRRSLLLTGRNLLRNFIAYRIIEPLFLKKVDLISTETSTGYEKLKEMYARRGAGRFFYQPYGVDIEYIKNGGIPVRPFEAKENLMVTAARLGIHQKNNELMLAALEKVDLKDWKFVFIGKIAEGFQTKIDDFYNRNPQLREKVEFTGHISDRKMLYQWFDRAKVFCLSSRFESFGLVLAEAALFGNYIVTTDVASARDLTGDERYGTIVPQENADSYAGVLNAIVDNRVDLKASYLTAIQNTHESFSWKSIVRGLDERIRSLK